MNKNKLNGGFIGILMLLIGVAIIIFFILRTDLFTGEKEDKNMIEQGSSYIDQAKEAKNMLEKNSQQTMSEE